MILAASTDQTTGWDVLLVAILVAGLVALTWIWNRK